MHAFSILNLLLLAGDAAEAKTRTRILPPVYTNSTVDAPPPAHQVNMVSAFFYFKMLRESAARRH